MKQTIKANKYYHGQAYKVYFATKTNGQCELIKVKRGESIPCQYESATFLGWCE